MKRFAVVDAGGAGWGRFDTLDEAKAHRDDLVKMRGEQIFFVFELLAV